MWNAAEAEGEDRMFFSLVGERTARWRLKVLLATCVVGLSLFLASRSLLAFGGTLWPVHDATVDLCSTRADAREVAEYASGVLDAFSARLMHLEGTDAPVDECTQGAYTLRFRVEASRPRIGDLYETFSDGSPSRGLTSRQLSYRTAMRGGNASVLVAFLAALLALAFHRGTRDDAGWRGTGAPRAMRDDIVLVAALLPAVYLVAIAYAALLGVAGPMWQGMEQATGESSLVIVMILLLVPLADEVIFRYWLLGRARAAIGDVPSLLLSSMLFSVANGEFDAGSTGLRFLMGLALGLIWLRTGSLRTCVVAHGLWQCPAVIVGIQAGHLF